MWFLALYLKKKQCGFLFSCSNWKTLSIKVTKLRFSLHLWSQAPFCFLSNFYFTVLIFGTFQYKNNILCWIFNQNPINICIKLKGFNICGHILPFCIKLLVHYRQLFHWCALYSPVSQSGRSDFHTFLSCLLTYWDTGYNVILMNQDYINIFHLVFLVSITTMFIVTIKELLLLYYDIDWKEVASCVPPDIDKSR